MAICMACGGTGIQHDPLEKHDNRPCSACSGSGFKTAVDFPISGNKEAKRRKLLKLIAKLPDHLDAEAAQWSEELKAVNLRKQEAPVKLANLRSAIASVNAFAVMALASPDEDDSAGVLKYQLGLIASEIHLLQKQCEQNRR